MANRWDGPLVIFIKPGGATVEIRLSERDASAMCRAAETLKASHFIAVDGFDNTKGLPIWGVFEMRTAQRNTPVPGEWSINDPVRTFTTKSPDPAVMYAIAVQGRR